MQRSNRPQRGTRHRTAVFAPPPRTAKTPLDLLLDPTIKAQEKILYPVYRSACHRYLDGKYPFTFISQETIGRRYLGWSQPVVSDWTHRVEDSGWCTIYSLGRGRSNVIVLHEMKGQTFTAEQKANFLRLARREQASYRQWL